ncbi:MAG: L-threonylcarbamoyladenylate synthase [Nitrospinota bacterium]|nr:L-threonylcarbamoyladenylate synthase [Nitrospinota bacterium]
MKHEIIKVSQNNPDKKVIEKTSEILNAGEIVVLPTDTVYGICVSAETENAIRKLSEIKGRSPGKGIPLIIGQHEQIFQFTNQVSSRKIKLLESIWPSPVTFIFDSKKFSEFTEDGIAIRLPEQELCRELALHAGPFLSTSANKTGKPILDNIEEICLHFKKDVQLFLDGGTIKENKASTIVSLKKDDPELIRNGKFPFEKIIHIWQKI